VSFHGISINVEPDLTHFEAIVPCGVTEPRYGVTSLADLGVATTMAEIDEALAREFAPLFGLATPAQAAADNLAPSLPAI
jgi:lipoyl(octanoyl) transferase